MSWKVEAGVPADYWFIRALNWVYSVQVREGVAAPQPMVVRVVFDVEPEVTPTKEEARSKLQEFLDNAAMNYSLYMFYACYEPEKQRLTLEIQVPRNQIVYDAVMLAGGLSSQHLGPSYWDYACDYASFLEYEATAVTAALEKTIPIAKVTEPSRLPAVILVGLGMVGIAVLITRAWRK